LLTAQKTAEFVILSSGVYCWSDCPQLIYNLMGVFSKESGFLEILKAEGEPLPRKITYKFYSQRTPACAVQSKAEEELLIPWFGIPKIGYHFVKRRQTFIP